MIFKDGPSSLPTLKPSRSQVLENLIDTFFETVDDEKESKPSKKKKKKRKKQKKLVDDIFDTFCKEMDTVVPGLKKAYRKRIKETTKVDKEEELDYKIVKLINKIHKSLKKLSKLLKKRDE